ncbi:hypothetical protein [Paenibacillus sp. FJAT-26967]|uniref:hypothetical protein n=1 Tax=Paenibacillus sp. FJAT-26967 TaxID=1729690 RepID=UPI0008391BBB|nr:hypothetical protein [Paenibacillus sp. FJAT-26967]
MKEAIITDTLGVFEETTLVTDDVIGVFPIYGPLPHPEEGSAEVQQEPKITGYRIAVGVPPGLYRPKWDFETESWTEALTPEEIEEIIKPQPQEATEAEQKIAALEIALAVQTEQTFTALDAVATVFEQLLSLQDQFAAMSPGGGEPTA